MEFTQYSCPVCGERFKNGDDVVVCPDCGAPHHRQCYEKLDNCFFADKHREGFNFESSGSGEDSGSDEAAEGVIKCPRCQAENDRTAFYCKTCGFPFNSEDRTNGDGPDRTDQQTNRAQGMPFGFGTAGNPMYDPLAGLKSDDEIADNVKVGEAAKFIGKSTPYYLPMFSRLKQYGSARFNFSAVFHLPQNVCAGHYTVAADDRHYRRLHLHHNGEHMDVRHGIHRSIKRLNKQLARI